MKGEPISESVLADRLLIIIEHSRKIEVLKNILYYSENRQFSRIARGASSISVGRFMEQFRSAGNEELLTVAWKELYGDRQEVGKVQFEKCLKPEVLENKQIAKEHNITQNYSKVMGLLVETVCNKAVARESLSTFIRQNSDWFRDTLKVFTGRIQMRQFLKILKDNKLTSFQMELFMNEFFKKEETVSMSELCGMRVSWNQTLSTDSKLSFPMSTLSCDSLTLPTPYIYQRFLQYITISLSHYQLIQELTQQFNQTYNQLTFRAQILQSYKKGLQTLNPHYTPSLFCSQKYQEYERTKTDLDLKEFIFVLKEFQLKGVSDEMVRIYFDRLQIDGLLTIDSFYDHLNNNRLCASEEGEIRKGNTCLESLLASHISMYSRLHEVKKSIWGSERNELFDLFNAIDVLRTGELTIELIETFLIKNEFKRPGEIYEPIVRLFGGERISLRRFILQFVVVG